MGWIGIESKDNIIPIGNGADFRWVSHHETVGRISLKEGKQMNAFFLVCASPGLGSATANQYREGIQKWVPAPVKRGFVEA